MLQVAFSPFAMFPGELMRLHVLGLAFALLLSVPLSAEEPSRPNVLWLCGDDLAAYVHGAYGNKLAHTPKLERLAAAGMRFDRAFCNSPVCTASRQSFLTGRYPRSVGVTVLKTPLPEKETTLAEMLKTAGYNTAAIGKMHFNSNLSHGFDVKIDQPDYRRWLQQKAKSPLPPGVDVQGPWKPFQDPARVWLNSANLPFGAVDADMGGTWLAREAEKYLQARGARRGKQAATGTTKDDGKTDNGDAPFFLMVSFYEPHSPFHFPVEFAGWHKADEFTASKVGPEDDWQIPEIFRGLTDR